MERSTNLMIIGEIKLDNLWFPFVQESVEHYAVPCWEKTSEKPII